MMLSRTSAFQNRDIHLQEGNLFEDILSEFVERGADGVVSPASFSFYFEKAGLFEYFEVT